MASAMMQKFWDSALALEPPDDAYDTHSELSTLMTPDGAEPSKFMYPSLGLGNSLAFKFEDPKGRVHRFNCGTENFDELVSIVMQRIGMENALDCQFLYEDDEGDKILLATDSDLIGAVTNARSVGLKVLRLHLDYFHSSKQASSSDTTVLKADQVSLQTRILVSAVLLVGTSVLIYLKRSKL